MRRPTLTLHAWHRWCQRARPMSYEALHEYLMTPGLCAAVAAGVTRVKLHRDGVYLQIRAGSIITVVPLSDPRRPRAWRGRRVRAELEAGA